MAMCCSSRRGSWLKVWSFILLQKWTIISWIMSWGWSFKFYTLQGTCVIITGPCYPTPSFQGLQPQQPFAVLPTHQGHSISVDGLDWSPPLPGMHSCRYPWFTPELPSARECCLYTAYLNFFFLHGTYHYLKYFRYWFGFSLSPTLSLPLSILFTDIPTGSKTSIWQTRYSITL